MNSKLRIGILLDNNLIPAWSYKMLEAIIKSSSSEIVLIVKNTPKNKITQGNENILFKLFTKLDKKLFKFTPNAFELKNILNILNIDTIEVIPNQLKLSDQIQEIDLIEIKKYKIDVFLKLGFRKLSGDILKSARYGVWCIVDGDNKIDGSGIQWFWKIIENKSEIRVSLQILSEDIDNGIVLFDSYSAIHNSSSNITKNNSYWKALSFIPLKIQELFDLGEESFFNNVNKLNTHLIFNSEKLNTKLSIKDMLLFGTKLTLTKIKNKLNAIFYFDQWILLFKINDTNTVSKSFHQFKKIIPPKDRIWADPFILRRNDKYYIFIEELIFAENIGFISVMIMDNEGNYSKPVKVLERDYHLSYPFLIEENGNLYMIPETKDNNNIELYKCTDFPFQWELEKVLMKDIAAVDTTIEIKNGKYWLFTNVVKNKGASDAEELFLYSSNSLVTDNWKAHPKNPIVSDVKKSRGAGNFFTFNGNLYRPSQNCAKRYGHGMKINQVIELTETNYNETVVDSIFPDWDKNLIATHTFNSVGNLTIIDAILKRKKLY